MCGRSVLFGLSFVVAITAAARCLTSAAPPAPTGRLRLTFTERSPLSAPDVVRRRLDLGDAPVGDRDALAYDLANESFDVVIPPTYRPDAPHGLLVWTGVTDFPPEWLGVLARHKLIYVRANDASGRLAMLALPLDAVHNLPKAHNVDEARVYVCGFSAGGAVAVHLLRGFPDVFRGGLFLMGGYFYHSHRPEGARRQPTVLPEESPTWKGPLEPIRRDVKIVLMKGQRDTQWTADEGRCDYESLLLDGFARVSYLEVPNLGHNHPTAAWFEKGVVALEAKPKPPPATRPTSQPRPLPGQIAQARRILSTALYQLDEKNWKSQWLKDHPELAERARATRRDRARQYVKQVLAEYPTTPAAAEARRLLDQMGPPVTSPATRSATQSRRPP